MIMKGRNQGRNSPFRKLDLPEVNGFLILFQLYYFFIRIQKRREYMYVYKKNRK